MKKFACIILILVVSQGAFAQKRAERLGKSAFGESDYQKATTYLGKVSDKSPEVLRMLAESQYFLNNFIEAMYHYRELSKLPEATASDIWAYAQTLMSLEMYTDADVQLERFYKMAPNDTRAVGYKQQPDFLQTIRASEPDIAITHLKANGTHQDFPSDIYRNQLIFTSSRLDGSPKRDVWTANQLPFLRPFAAGKEDKGELTDIRPFMPDILAGNYHVGPVTINKQENMMAVTVNYPEKKKMNGTINLQLLIARFVDGSWTPLKPLPFNNPAYSVGHAAFSPDGKTMYFVSDMPGGKGGTDIYTVAVPTSDNWPKPVNMAGVNTEGHEMFPYCFENYLFFSSDGHVGLGGLDVFYTLLAAEKPGDIVNMGYPINSARDDFALVIDSDLKTGYFASRRIGGIGNDDIYHFSLKEAIAVETEPVIPDEIPHDSSGLRAAQPQPQSQPQPQPEPAQTPEEIPPVRSGLRSAQPEPQQPYAPGVLIQINPIFFDFDKSDIRPDAAAELGKIVEVMNEHPQMIVELGAHTDCRGTEGYNLLLSRARMNNALDYIKRRISTPERLSGFFYGKTQLLNRCDCTENPPCSEEEHQLNRRTEFKIISLN